VPRHPRRRRNYNDFPLASFIKADRGSRRRGRNAKGELSLLLLLLLLLPFAGVLADDGIGPRSPSRHGGYRDIHPDNSILSASATDLDHHLK
jgi:hypothetical protein